MVNSGAIKNDAKLLFMDWCGLMNRGLSPTPVGGSDSHDVSKFIVGYIRCDDSNAGAIEIEDSVDAFLAGRVVVSYGLFANLTVNGEPFTSGLVSVGQNGLELTVEVHGPAWADVDSVELYVCGQRSMPSDGGRVPIPASPVSDDSTPGQQAAPGPLGK